MSKLKSDQAKTFIQMVLSIGCMGLEQFEEMSKKTWPEYWQHMNNKYYSECNAEPWLFITKLDESSLEKLINWYNKK